MSQRSELSRKQRMEPLTTRSERRFKYALVDLWRPEVLEPLGVEMCDERGQRQTVFDLRAEWRYVLTNAMPDDETPIPQRDSTDTETDSQEGNSIGVPDCSYLEDVHQESGPTTRRKRSPMKDAPERVPDERYTLRPTQPENWHVPLKTRYENKTHTVTSRH
jgi:hypothetical protein